MPQTKTKPAAAAQPIQPEPPQLTEQQKEEATEKHRRQLLGELVAAISDLSKHELETLRDFKLVMDHDRGSTTPIEEFLTGLVHSYSAADEGGRGMTLADVEWHMTQLRDADLEREIEHAHFMASRYPLPSEAEAK